MTSVHWEISGLYMAVKMIDTSEHLGVSHKTNKNAFGKDQYLLAARSRNKEPVPGGDLLSPLTFFRVWMWEKGLQVILYAKEMGQCIKCIHFVPGVMNT